MTANPPAFRPYLAEPMVQDFVWLCERMRADERDQHQALNGAPVEDYDPQIAARGMMVSQGPQFVLRGPGGFPIVVGGFQPAAVGVVQTWMIGTDEGWAQHWRAITKATRRCMSALFKTSPDIHRIQTMALAERTAAHDWYVRGLGMTREGVSRCFTADGRDVVHFGLLREETR